MPLCLSPLSGRSLWLSTNFPYMPYFATVVTLGSSERALGGLVVLPSRPVTMITDPALNFAKHPWFCCTSCILQLTNVFCCGLHSQCQLQSFLQAQLCFQQQSMLNEIIVHAAHEAVLNHRFECRSESTSTHNSDTYRHYSNRTVGD